MKQKVEKTNPSSPSSKNVISQLTSTIMRGRPKSNKKSIQKTAKSKKTATTTTVSLSSSQRQKSSNVPNSLNSVNSSFTKSKSPVMLQNPPNTHPIHAQQPSSSSEMLATMGSTNNNGNIEHNFYHHHQVHNESTTHDPSMMSSDVSKQVSTNWNERTRMTDQLLQLRIQKNSQNLDISMPDQPVSSDSADFMSNVYLPDVQQQNHTSEGYMMTNSMNLEEAPSSMFPLDISETCQELINSQVSRPSLEMSISNCESNTSPKTMISPNDIGSPTYMFSEQSLSPSNTCPSSSSSFSSMSSRSSSSSPSSSFQNTNNNNHKAPQKMFSANAQYANLRHQGNSRANSSTLPLHSFQQLWMCCHIQQQHIQFLEGKIQRLQQQISLCKCGNAKISPDPSMFSSSQRISQSIPQQMSQSVSQQLSQQMSHNIPQQMYRNKAHQNIVPSLTKSIGHHLSMDTHSLQSLESSSLHSLESSSLPLSSQSTAELGPSPQHFQQMSQHSLSIEADPEKELDSLCSSSPPSSSSSSKQMNQGISQESEKSDIGKIGSSPSQDQMKEMDSFQSSTPNLPQDHNENVLGLNESDNEEKQTQVEQETEPDLFDLFSKLDNYTFFFKAKQMGMLPPSFSFENSSVDKDGLILKIVDHIDQGDKELHEWVSFFKAPILQQTVPSTQKSLQAKSSDNDSHEFVEESKEDIETFDMNWKQVVSTLKGHELKQILKSVGLISTGSKARLQSILVEHIENSDKPKSFWINTLNLKVKLNPIEKLKNLSVSELKAKVKEMGLQPKNANKMKLIEMIKQNLKQETSEPTSSKEDSTDDKSFPSVVTDASTSQTLSSPSSPSPMNENTESFHINSDLIADQFQQEFLENENPENEKFKMSKEEIERILQVEEQEEKPQVKKEDLPIIEEENFEMKNELFQNIEEEDDDDDDDDEEEEKLEPKQNKENSHLDSGSLLRLQIFDTFDLNNQDPKEIFEKIVNNIKDEKEAQTFFEEIVKTLKTQVPVFLEKAKNFKNLPKSVSSVPVAKTERGLLICPLNCTGPNGDLCSFPNVFNLERHIRETRIHKKRLEEVLEKKKRGEEVDADIDGLERLKENMNKRRKFHEEKLQNSKKRKKKG